VAVGVTKQPFFFYFVACMIYLALSIVSSVGIRAVERWSERGQTGRRSGPAGISQAAK
jgi:polar amino acid transport system permease protein